MIYLTNPSQEETLTRIVARMVPMESDDGKSNRQFSLRAMLVVTAGVAVVVGVAFVFPWWFALIAMGCFAVASPPILTVVALHSRDSIRAFAIGAMIPQIAFSIALFLDAFVPQLLS